MSNPNDKYTQNDETRFTLRIDTDILNKVKELTKKTKRSTAKEIEFILEQYIQNMNEE